MIYNTIACGGTFDHFHKGHEAFLHFCFQKGNKVIIGITSDRFLESNKKSNVSTMQLFAQREKSVKRFLQTAKLQRRAMLVSIDDIYGPTLDSSFAIDALVVTDNVLHGADAINKKRAVLGLNTLPILIAPLLSEEGEVISSSRIRMGKSDRQGKPFVKREWEQYSLTLTKKARSLCKKPLGKIVNQVHNLKTNVYLVGDVTTDYFNKNKIPYDVAIVDLYVERKKRYASLADHLFPNSMKTAHVKNAPGTLTPALFAALKSAVIAGSTPFVVQVDGEEDLSVLPLVLYVPLGTTVIYGQPGKGMVIVSVDEVMKHKVHRILSLFERMSS